MTRLAYLGLLLVALVAIVYVLFSAAGGEKSQNVLEPFATGELSQLSFESAGTAAPQDRFQDEAGNPVTLEAFRGKMILVNFWATWCGPCEAEMPSLGALQTARGGDQFEVVAISVDDGDDRDYAKRRLSELGASNITFHIAPPDAYEIVYGAGVRGFPTSVLYDSEGREIARLERSVDWASLDAINFVDAALKK